MGKNDRLRDVKHLLHVAAYTKPEIDRILDKKHPAFIEFDPVLGYLLRDYIFRDGMDGTLNSYVYEPHGGHRKMVNFAGRPCRINTYGDSYTQCAQVASGETWQEILAAHFNEPIRNFGVGGYGVYQAYRRAMRTEAIKNLAAPYLVLNIWDDDHMRNIDAARWIRVGWMIRDIPRGKKDSYPVHGFPWAHVRYDLTKGDFVELPGLCRNAEELRWLVGKDNYYNAFKDDHVAALYTLREGGEAPVEFLEQLAEAFGLKVNLRNRKTRAADARRLHYAYGVRSSMFICTKLRSWCEKNHRRLMVLLSYDVPTVRGYIQRGERFDAEIVPFLKQNRFTYVDTLPKLSEEYENWRMSLDAFLNRLHVGRAGAQVFGHYNPYGNFWFAQAIRKELADWLDPKPFPYR